MPDPEPDTAPELTPIEYEALALAAWRRAADYDLRHLNALARLRRRKLVRHVRSRSGAW